MTFSRVGVLPGHEYIFYAFGFCLVNHTDRSEDNRTCYWAAENWCQAGSWQVRIGTA